MMANDILRVAAVGWRAAVPVLTGSCTLRRLHARDRRWVPLAGERLQFRGVETHRQVERSFRGWEPVGLLVRAGAGVLEIEIERSVRVVLEGHPTADGKTIERVGYLEALAVISRDRPESTCRRHLPFVEVKRVFVRAIKRLAGLITEIEGIDRILGKVRAKPNLGDDGALQVVVSIDAHRVGVHLPAVRDPRQGRHLPCHQLLRFLCGTRQSALDGRIGFVEVEGLAWLNSYFLQLREDGLIGDVWRV